MKKIRRSDQGAARGFTLVELLVVMGIIGVLVSLLIPAVTYAYQAARVASTKQTIHSLADGLYAFKADWGMFPPSSKTAGKPGADGRYTQQYGYMNLAMYLIGPQGQGWGYANNQGAPFGGAATQQYGPYFQPAKGAEIHVVRDSFPLPPPPNDKVPRGCILYYRFDPNDNTGNPTGTGLFGRFAWDDNPPGSTSDTGQGFASDAHFRLSFLYRGYSGVGGTQQRWRSEDFVLVSSGPDRLFGYVTNDDPPVASASLDDPKGAFCDDVTNVR
jgi:prepilin-type N-terminal cleavage/methylation domain-containing protein